MASQTASASADAHEIDAHGAKTASAYESAEAHGDGGLPQLEMQHWAGQVAWLLIIFVVLYVLLSRVFLPKLRAVQDERADTIAEAVQTARTVQDEARRQAEAAQAEVVKARADARSTAVAAKARVNEEANARQAAEEAVVNARIAEAEASIAQTRDTAMSNVASIASDATSAIVERLTGKPATQAEVSSTLKGAA